MALRRITRLAIYLLLAGPALAAPSRVLPKQVNLLADTTALLGEFYDFNSKSCRSTGTVKVEVLVSPTHGTVEVLRSSSKIQPPSEEFARCKGKTIRSVIGRYTPSRGFKGLDYLNLKITSTMGVIYTMPIGIEVK